MVCTGKGEKQNMKLLLCLNELFRMFKQAYRKDTEMGRINRSMGKIVYPCVLLMLVATNVLKYFVSSITVSLICVCLMIPMFIAFTIHNNRIKHVIKRDELIYNIQKDIKEKR